MKVDFEEMTAKYNEERLKRLKKAGNEQYTHISDSKLGVLPDMVDDPFVDPNFKRDPVTENHDIIIAGGGVGGIIMACRLVKAGFQNIKIIEKAGDFGGVW
jgi:cyclohexanone monooxygenase